MKIDPATWAGHTPGPFTASKDSDTRGNPSWRFDAPGVSLVASASYQDAAARDDDEATARLIEAAPQLAQEWAALREALARLLREAEELHKEVNTFRMNDGREPYPEDDSLIAARAILSK